MTNMTSSTNHINMNTVSNVSHMASKLKVNQFSVKTFEQMTNSFPNTLFYSVSNGWVMKTTPDTIFPLLTFLKCHTSTSFKQLSDLTAMDYYERKLRFEVVYNLLSLQNTVRVCMSVSMPETSSLPSVVSIYPSAGWYERETWDSFGIFFSNHADHRRSLTDYGFKGHPLRKDFPLTGFVEVRYDDSRKRILYEGMSLPQEYRIFTLENPWKSSHLIGFKTHYFLYNTTFSVFISMIYLLFYFMGSCM